MPTLKGGTMLLHQQHLNQQQTDELPPFEDIYSTYKGYVYQRVYILVHNREEAEDLTQDTFLKAWRAYPALQAPFNVAAWLSRIATNTVIDAKRHQKTLVWQPLEPLEEGLEAEESADPQTRYSTTAEVVHAVLARLPVQYRLTLLLHVQGYTTAEIANMLGIQTSNRRNLYSHAKQCFKQAYAVTQ
jgi:RNA polymerase sigma-70 factor (ECF subfamily)